MTTPGRIIFDAATAVPIAGSAKTVAVLGIKTMAQGSQAGYFVPDYLSGVGVEIIPVPVFYPETREILGRPVQRDLRAISQHIDILDVFRKPSDLFPHLEDILALKPDVVWLQSGIRNEGFEKAVAAAGIDVVADRCLKVDRQVAESHRSSL